MCDFSDLLSRVAGGNQDAEAELYVYMAENWRFLRPRWVNLQDLMDDILHDTYIIVLRAAREERIKDPAGFPAYVRVTARRIASDLYGKRVREPLMEEPASETADSSKSVEEVLVVRERSRILAEIVQDARTFDVQTGRSGSKYSSILTQFYFQEKSKEEIKADMNLSERSYHLLKNRAVTKLRAIAPLHALAA